MYIDGGSLDKLIDAAQIIGPIVKSVLDSDSEEKTKRLALELIKNSLPGVNNCNISNVSVNMSKDT